MEGCKAGSFPSKIKESTRSKHTKQGGWRNIIGYTLKRYQAFLFSAAHNLANNNVWQTITKKQRIRFISFGEPKFADPCCCVNLLSPSLNIYCRQVINAFSSMARNIRQK